MALIGKKPSELDTATVDALKLKLGIGEGGGMVDITYADLITAITGGTLVAGTFYQITDYKTVYWMMNRVNEDIVYSLADGNKIIKEADAVEPIIVLAISTSDLSPIAYSTLYPDDILHYSPLLPDSLLTFDTPFYNGTDGTPNYVTGFTGVITYRIDTINNIKAQLDWRNWLYRKYSVAQEDWVAQAYDAGVYVQYTDENPYTCIYKSLVAIADTAQVETVTLTGTSGTVDITEAGGLTKLVTFAEGGTQDLTQTAADFVTSFADDYLAVDIVVTSSGADIIFTANEAGTGFTAPVITNASDDLAGTVVHTTANYSVATMPNASEANGYWIKILDITENTYISYANTTIRIGEDNSLSILDAEDFLEVPILGQNCYNIELQNDLVVLLLRQLYLPFMTFGSDCSNMTFGSGCSFMTFGSECSNMTFGVGCNDMTFESNCRAMTFGIGCNGMTFGIGCSNMTFGSRCSSMTFGIGCSNMTFGSGCSNMTFESGCYNMTFGIGCYAMTFPAYTAFNDFKSHVCRVDFTAAGITQIITGITVTHQMGNNGSVVQSYLNYVTDHYEMVYTTGVIGIYLNM